MLRNFFIIVLLAAFTAYPAVLFASDVERTPVKLMLLWYDQSEFAGLYVAYEKGFYRSRGLDVQFLRGGPDVAGEEFLKEGKADFAVLPLVIALESRSQGVPLIHLVQFMNRSNFALVAWKDQGIHEAGDLHGRKISVWEEAGGIPFLMFFDKHNIKPVLRPQYATVNLFLRRGLDACSVMVYNTYYVLIQSGVNPEELTVFFMRDHGFDFPEDGLYCIEKMFRGKPALCRAMALASLEGWRYAAEHPEEALDIVMHYVKKSHVPTNRTHMKWMLDKILPAVVPEADSSWKLGELSPEDFERVHEALRQYGYLEKPVSFADFTGEDSEDGG